MGIDSVWIDKSRNVYISMPLKVSSGNLSEEVEIEKTRGG